MTNKFETRICDEWAHWVNSKKLFAPPVQKNILLSLQQLPSKEMPNAELSQAMVYYNMAVNSLEPLQIAVWLIKTFNLRVYRSRKDAIHRLGFNNSVTFYNWAESSDKQINKRYNQIRNNAEESARREIGVVVTYKKESLPVC